MAAACPSAQLLVIAKEPVPGRVKTRLCPPCTARQAADVGAAALADTLDTVTAVDGAVRTLLLEGRYAAPPGWRTVHQRGSGLAARLVNGYADTALEGVPSLLIGMDTPQISTDVLDGALATVNSPGIDAVVGLAADGGWWALGLRDPAHADVLRGVPMSTTRTGERTITALRDRGLTVAPLAVLRDVDTALDAWLVASLCATTSRFAAAVAAHVPMPAAAAP